MRTCEEITELLSPYIDGELPETDCQLVEEHLAGCEQCRMERDALDRIDEIASAVAPPVSEAQWRERWDAIAQRTVSARRAPVTTALRMAVFSRRFLVPKLLAAAAVILVFLASFFSAGGPRMKECEVEYIETSPDYFAMVVEPEDDDGLTVIMLIPENESEEGENNEAPI